MEWNDGLLSAAIRNYVHMNTADYSKIDNDFEMSGITDLSNVSLLWSLIFSFD